MTQKSIIIQLCFSMFVFILPDVDSAPDLNTELRKFKDYQAQIDRMGVLEYGDRCHSEEVKVKDTAKKVFEKIVTFDLSSIFTLGVEMESLNEAYKQILSTGHKLCNDSKLLACDESSNLCTCRPTRITNREFSYVRDAKKGCLYAKGSACFPLDDTYNKSNSSCANDSKCVLINSQGEDVYCGLPNYYKAITIRLDMKVGIPECYCKANFDEVSQQGNSESFQKSNPTNSNQTNSCELCSLNTILFLLSVFPSFFIFNEIF